jgi:hypothetical protein
LLHSGDLALVLTPAFASNQAEFGLYEYEVLIRPMPFPWTPSTVSTTANILTMQDKEPPVYPSLLTEAAGAGIYSYTLPASIGGHR